MTERSPSREGLRRARRRRFPFAVGCLALLMLLGAIVLLSISPGRAVKGSLEAGRSELSRAQRMMTDGSFSGAMTAFDKAKASFADASSHARNPWLRIVSFLPLAGRTADALAGLAQIGSDIASAGSSVAQGVAELPDGLSSLAPRHGQIPIETIRQLAPAVSQARSALEQAQMRADSLPTTWVLGPVSEAGETVKDKLEEGLRLAQATDALLTALPDFAGDTGTRRYFVAGVNPAELRGTGGLLGVYSILTMRHGRFSLAPFTDVGELKRTTHAHISAPDSEMAYLYGDSVASSWSSVNLMPDAPTSAGLITDLWNKTHEDTVDGVIFVDPQALALLLRATGPVRTPSLGVTLTADTFVPYVANKAYFIFEDRSAPSGQRKQALGIAAQAIWKRFTSDAPAKAALDSLSEAASAGHIIVDSADPAVQSAFEEAGIAGEFRAGSGDFFSSIVNNAAGNKVDYYMRRQMRYEVTLGEDGSAVAGAQVIMTNDAPRGAKPGYAMGPYGPGVGTTKLEAGENYSTVQTYCAALCEGSDPTLNGSPMTVGQATEQGLTLYLTSLTIKPQQTRTLSYSFDLRNVWQGDGVGGTYRLHLQGQPTIKPTTASVIINVPQGMSISSASDGVRVAGDRAYWSGEVGKGVDLEVSFQQPLAARTWTRFRGFLSRPVF